MSNDILDLDLLDSVQLKRLYKDLEKQNEVLRTSDKLLSDTLEHRENEILKLKKELNKRDNLLKLIQVTHYSYMPMSSGDYQRYCEKIDNELNNILKVANE